nr:XRE family transcriptional regulator [uncultured Lachnoclostridium sp.]
MKQVTLDLNYSENYFYTLKNGKQPSAEKLNEIADYFGVSVDYLLGRTDNLSNENNNLKETLEQPTLLFYGGEKLTEEDKEAVADYLEGYLLNKKRKEALKRKK